MRALFIAYHFPPIGGAGSQRSQKFVKYLGDFGVQPVVIAGPQPTGRDRWEPADRSLSTEIPEGTAIYRPEGPPPQETRTDAVLRRLTFTTARQRWWQRQIASLGRAALGEHEVDAILVTLSPYEGLAAALELGEKAGLPVVADLRDPWALDEVRLYPSALHRRSDELEMGRLLDRCALVIANTKEAAAAMSDRFAPLAGRIRVLPNGFDPVDFEGLEPGRQSPEELRIVHTGYLHSALGLAQLHRRGLKRVLAGGLTDVNLLARSHYYLLRAVEDLRRTDPQVAGRVRIILAGVLSDSDERLIEDSSVGDQVEAVGYVSHREAIRQMLSASVLFLPMHDLPAGFRARIVPGKTYEYLAANRPILGALPEGDARDLVRSHEGIVVAPTDVAGIRDAIADLAATGSPTSNGLRRGIQDFERCVLAERLATYLRDAGAS